MLFDDIQSEEQNGDVDEENNSFDDNFGHSEDNLYLPEIQHVVAKNRFKLLENVNSVGWIFQWRSE